jgi:hypothetical protein
MSHLIIYVDTLHAGFGCFQKMIIIDFFLIFSNANFNLCTIKRAWLISKCVPIFNYVKKLAIETTQFALIIQIYFLNGTAAVQIWLKFTSTAAI